MGRHRQRWKVGDVFSIGASDGLVSVGQVIGIEPDLMRSATVALFDERYRSLEECSQRIELDPKTLFAVLFVTTNHLDSGDWRVFSHCPGAVDPRRNPYEHTRNAGFVGAKIIGANIVNEFVNAFYGLSPWDDWKDPNYLDSLLISNNAKPMSRLVYKKQ